MHSRQTSAQDANPAPRIIFNSDGDFSMRAHKPYQNLDEFCRGVDELRGTQVDVYNYSVSAGGDVFKYPSAIAPIVGEDLDDLDNVPASLLVEVENLKGFAAAGLDPVAVMAQRTHAAGMRFWISLRMNDTHDDVPECAVLHGSFRKAHPEWLIGSPYPEPRELGNPETGFSWALDYAQPAVRERQLAIIEELVSNYDVEGIELDFLRGPYYFKTAERERGMLLLTDFVRSARQIVAAVAGRKGRPLTIAIRLDRTMEACRAKGIDARTWIEEELADYFIPMHPGRLDMGADVARFAEAARGTACQIIGGLDGAAYSYGHLADHESGPWRHPTVEMMRAAAMGYYAQGAAGVYLFNFDCHRFRGAYAPYSAEEMQMLHEIGSPATIAGKNTRYVVTADQHTHFTGALESRRLPLPTTLSLDGPARHFSIYIGDDVEAAIQAGRLTAARLRLTVDGYLAPADELCVQMNGQIVPLPRNHWRPQALVYTNLPVRQGANEITISVTRRRPDATKPMRLDGVELLLNYRSAEAPADRPGEYVPWGAW